MRAVAINNMTVGEIEKILSVYPWFAYARRELLIKMSALGEEYRNDALRRTNMYIYPEKDPFYLSYHNSLNSIEVSEFIEPVYELDYFDTVTIEESVSDQTQKAEPSPRADKSSQSSSPTTKKEVYVIGGDYFSNSDFEGLSKDGMESFNSLTSIPSAGEIGDFIASEFNDESYYTETLARIYAQQELYERAYEVYDKLILLYPEKSAYFATLKGEIKKQL